MVQCDCGRRSFAIESEAAAAATDIETDLPFRYYKCPGNGRHFHLLEPDFSRATLHSRARLIAWHILAADQQGRPFRPRELLTIPDLRIPSWDSSGWKKATEILIGFSRHGLTTRTRREGLRVADRDGLYQVIALGWNEFKRRHPG